MASVDECRQALQELGARLSANVAEAREKLKLDRTLACRISDLDTAFHGRLLDGQLVELADGDDPNAKIAITTTSDDLVALVRGELNAGQAIATRRISVKANPFDLLKLRSLL
ncbi:SCP-2 sterol transfer family protein [Micromonospora pattaloongensis]|uniref:SCP-2 sterol transfer family protein n=1 Tax=Micromonospora pattaloongensis TaxID=405436 RepID=A0A1H3T2C3_9ACTN|nr:SCP2 sterol-binding domain-containing protein [Micromonospora pattaloongensis]SDZ43981.1 SCP-2 sterol transfer family protein [Micromonospora pattaloongensis]